MRHRRAREPRAVAALALVSAALLAGCGGADAGSAGGVEELTVSGAWARPTPAAATNGVVYLSIVSPVDDTIVGVDVATSVAADATVHTSVGADGSGGHEHHGGGEDGAVTMAEQERVALPAGTTVQFEPGRLHVMLTELAGPLVEGERFELTIELASGGTVDSEVTVAVNPP